MRITRLQLRNYKSYYQPVTLELTTGMNMITGQNNVGKTALLEAMGFKFISTPHRSVKTVPTIGSPVDEVTRIDVSFEITQAELRQFLVRLRGENIFLPRPILVTPFADSIGYARHDNEGANRLMEWFLTRPGHTLELVFEQREGQGGQWTTPRFGSFGGYEADQKELSNVHVGPGHDMRFRYQGNVGGTSQDFSAALGPLVAERIYTFRAERFNLGSYPFGAAEQLAPDARNLAEVLNAFQHKHTRFRQFNAYVTEIFPHVQWVGVRPVPTPPESERRVEIVVSPHDPELARDDLAIPLSNCGTGIGQVIAILYVVLSSNNPQVVIIDEPQSFLHPGAARKLIEILKRHPDHQYVVATHSPTVISAADPQIVFMVKLTNGESSIQTMDATSAASQRTFLAEVGATLSDVFGADNILWVEGLTEEICFPRILGELASQYLGGTTIKGVVATGDFDHNRRQRSRPELVLQIYERLSAGSSLIPPALAFIFDSDGRTAQEKEDLQKRSNGRMRFTARRMYENYLLNAAAIAAVANAEQTFGDAPISENTVLEKLKTLMADAKYYDVAVAETDRDASTVNGSRILRDLFRDLSEKKADYLKTTHALALTEWLIRNAPEDLAEIKDLIISSIR